ERRFGLPHLLEVAAPIHAPVQPLVRIHLGMQRAAGAEIGHPLVPGLVGLAHAARAIAADEDARAVAWLRRVVPATRADHGTKVAWNNSSRSRPTRSCRPSN